MVNLGGPQPVQPRSASWLSKTTAAQAAGKGAALVLSIPNLCRLLTRKDALLHSLCHSIHSATHSRLHAPRPGALQTRLPLATRVSG